MNYRATIGLEIHVQLKTRSKLFCACPTDYEAAPNRNVCPVCLGYPGALPALNIEAVRLTVLTGLMMGARIPPVSRFDRKSYFYPDMAKNYQISQLEHPLCVGGAVEVPVGDSIKRIGITRIHLEEDVGKSAHAAGYSTVDFNRAGLALMEIVTEPDMESAGEAFAFLQSLRQILRYIEVSECNLEQGNMRCDVNVSVRPENQDCLGTKTEIKNMNTFKGILQALRHEIGRQEEVLRSGGTVEQETRRWDPDLGITLPMRGKEDAHDYRYFPEPDLPPVILNGNQIREWGDELPELPVRRRERMIKNYDLPPYDAAVLSQDRAVADFFEAGAAVCGLPKALSNLMMTEVLRMVAARETSLTSSALTPESLGELVCLVNDRVINLPTAKGLLPELFDRGGKPSELVEQRGLKQVANAGAIEEWVAQAIAGSPDAVRDFKSGKRTAAKYLVGQVMKASRGKADPVLVGGTVEKQLRRLTNPAERECSREPCGGNKA